MSSLLAELPVQIWLSLPGESPLSGKDSILLGSELYRHYYLLLPPSATLSLPSKWACGKFTAEKTEVCFKSHLH